MIKRKEGCLMKNTLWRSDWFCPLLVAGCTPKTPTAVSSTNEQKKQQYQLVKQVHPYNKKQRRHQRRQVR